MNSNQIFHHQQLLHLLTYHYLKAILLLNESQCLRQIQLDGKGMVLQMYYRSLVEFQVGRLLCDGAILHAGTGRERIHLQELLFFKNSRCWNYVSVYKQNLVTNEINRPHARDSKIDKHCSDNWYSSCWSLDLVEDDDVHYVSIRHSLSPNLLSFHIRNCDFKN